MTEKITELLKITKKLMCHIKITWDVGQEVYFTDTTQIIYCTILPIYPKITYIVIF